MALPASATTAARSRPSAAATLPYSATRSVGIIVGSSVLSDTGRPARSMVASGVAAGSTPSVKTPAWKLFTNQAPVTCTPESRTRCNTAGSWTMAYPWSMRSQPSTSSDVRTFSLEPISPACAVRFSPPRPASA